MNGKANASGSLQGQVIQEHGGGKTVLPRTLGVGYADSTKLSYEVTEKDFFSADRTEICKVRCLYLQEIPQLYSYTEK